MEKRPKQTQGQIKTRLRLKELFENDTFRRELEAILSIKNGEKRNKKMWKFAEKYSLEYEQGSPLLDLVMGINPKLDEQIGHELDVCQLFDEVDEYLNYNFPIDFDIPPSRSPRRRAQLIAFPIHLGISTKATKRDVLDYVNKRWDYIRYELDGYEENPKGIRRRRKQERNEFIWKNKDLPAIELANKVNEKFQNESLTYADINTIKSYLKKRRSKLN